MLLRNKYERALGLVFKMMFFWKFFKFNLDSASDALTVLFRLTKNKFLFFVFIVFGLKYTCLSSVTIVRVN
jgi:hypothetical protein